MLTTPYTPPAVDTLLFSTLRLKKVDQKPSSEHLWPGCQPRYEITVGCSSIEYTFDLGVRNSQPPRPPRRTPLLKKSPPNLGGVTSEAMSGWLMFAQRTGCLAHSKVSYLLLMKGLSGLDFSPKNYSLA
jgi:hypothetical protein